LVVSVDLWRKKLFRDVLFLAVNRPWSLFIGS